MWFSTYHNKKHIDSIVSFDLTNYCTYKKLLNSFSMFLCPLIFTSLLSLVLFNLTCFYIIMWRDVSLHLLVSNSSQQEVSQNLNKGSQFFIRFIEKKSHFGSFLCLGNMKEAKFLCFPTKRNYFATTSFNDNSNAVKPKTGKTTFTFPPFSKNMKK